MSACESGSLTHWGHGGRAAPLAWRFLPLHLDAIKLPTDGPLLSKVLCRPKRCKLPHAFLLEHSHRRQQLAQLHPHDGSYPPG